MNYTHAVIFYDENKPGLKIRADQYINLKALLKKEQFVEINGESYNRSDIRRVEKLKIERPGLPEHTDPPITKNFLQKFKEEMTKKFTA